MRKRILPLIAASCAGFAQQIEPVKIWDDKALADWATPIAGLNVRPGHYSERQYYAAPNGEWLRTYPVYLPGREPVGYWDMLLRKSPEPLITPGKRNRSAWVAAGRIVFEELDSPASEAMTQK